MKQILLLAGLFAVLPSLAQDPTVQKLRTESEKTVKKDPKDTIDKIWKAGGLYNLNVSQSSLSNWAAGGDEFSISINSVLNLYAFYKKGKHNWDNTFDFSLGYVNTTGLGSRKNDDRFDLLSKYGYELAPKWNLAALFNMRSQFFKGYTYPEDIKTYVSDFFAPAYILLGIGIDFKPVQEFSIYLSPATARWVIVSDEELSNSGAYGVTPGETSLFEFGAFFTINYLKQLNDNLAYKGRLDLFSNYLKNPENIDVNMTNMLSVKLTDVLAATWGVDIIYDDDVKIFGPNQNAPRTQVKSVVGLGLQVKF